MFTSLVRRSVRSVPTRSASSLRYFSSQTQQQQDKIYGTSQQLRDEYTDVADKETASRDRAKVVTISGAIVLGSYLLYLSMTKSKENKNTVLRERAVSEADAILELVVDGQTSLYERVPIAPEQKIAK